MSLLFSPITVRNVTFKNRLVVSPMCQYSAKDGYANDWHLVHLGSRAVGGAGLIFTEAVAVSPEGRISPFDLGLWEDGQKTMLQRITEFITQNGTVPGIQLAHAGRKASLTQPWCGDKYISPADGGWDTVAPSAVAYSSSYSTPAALNIDGIKRIVEDFKKATIRAIDAGFEVIEIHAAHGYLIHEFMSPLSNFRTDEYGGSFENRIRLLLEIVQTLRGVMPENMPLFVRISASDWHENGWTIDDSVQLGTILKELGVDVVDCSSGAILPDIKIPARPNYQVPFAEAVRKTGILTGAVGIIFQAEQAEEILQNGQADFIFMAREMLRDPYFPLHAAIQMNEDEGMWPLQYERAKRMKK